MYVAYLALQSGERQKRRLSAVYGIIAFINVLSLFLRPVVAVHSPIVVSSDGIVDGKMPLHCFPVWLSSLCFISTSCPAHEIIALREQVGA